jgi:D-glycero-alpha-D-manno-heptose 1-phosphate guanylyltransferase
MLSVKKIQAVILAGGKGQRLGNLGKHIPKALVKINGNIFLDIIIKQLKKNKINNFLILTGYKKEQIISHYQDKKNIFPIKGKTNWQTLTRIVKAKDVIKGPYFLLMYCDNFLENFSLTKVLTAKKKHPSKIIFSVVKKKKNQKGPILLKKNKLIYQDDIDSNYAEAGYMLINKSFFFKNIKNFKGNKLSEYLKYLSKTSNFTGNYYSDKFFCIENQKLIKETQKYFK